MIENIKKPLAKTIIIHPRYLDKNVCKYRKKSSETAEFKDTTTVIAIISNTEVINLDLLILFIFVMYLVKHN
tara:strand:- start:94 stop:309 length:216 start_codon:yes stop_codon:yes gene_type:complete